MTEFLNLKGKMQDWGPFTRETLETLVFSIGNPWEGHGPALCPDNDSRCANFVAYHVSERAGARFVAHIPYTTDRVGEIAKDWAPGYLPMDECVKKSVEFVRFHCKAYKDQGIPFSKILIVVGHGGNNGIEKYPEWDGLKKEFNLTDILFTGTFNVDVGKILQALEPYSDETRTAYMTAAQGAGHAHSLEHSIASLYGGVDWGKFHTMNQFIKDHGSDEALKKWPCLGGLGGYIKFGGEQYEPLRKVGLGNCLKRFEEDASVSIFPEFARIIMENSLQKIVRMIKPPEDD